MATVPSWIEKENAQKAEASRKVEEAAQRSRDAANFIQKRGMGYWDQLALALQFNAQALEKLEGEELFGSVSKAANSTEHTLHIRVERRSVKHEPDFAWLNLWYVPGTGWMRCCYMDRARPNIAFVVDGSPDLGRNILANYEGVPLTADQLGERIIRGMAMQVRAKKRR